MKNRISKILGVGLTVALLASLILVAAPVSAGTIAWTGVATPNPGNEQLQEATDVDVLAMAPDGETMFAYSNPANSTTLATTAIASGDTVTSLTVTATAGFSTGNIWVGSEEFDCTTVGVGTFTVTSKVATAAHAVGAPVSDGGLLYKSTDAGATWTTSSIGGTLECNPSVVAMAISPNYADDTTLVVATTSKVYRSINGGTTFGEVNTADLLIESGANGTDVFITSIDLARYYTGGELAIVVGTKDTDPNEGGGVFLCRMDNWDWVDKTVGNTPAGTGSGSTDELDVYAVAFSPNHLVDAQILAVGVYVDGTKNDTTYLTTMFAGTNWGAQVLDTAIPGTTVGYILEAQMTYATMAFADDYEWSIMNRVLVGITGTNDVLEDVYRVHGALPGGTSAAYDLNLSGSGSENDVYSIAISGDIVGATVVVGLQDSTTVKRTADPTASTVIWSSTIKAPIGDATSPDTIVMMSPDFATDDTVYAATDGADSCFSVSTDGGIMFNGISLIDIDVGTGADFVDIEYVDSAIVDDDTMFVLIHDDDDASGTFNANETQMVFKTTDGGATWVRVLFHETATGGTEGLSILGVSPDYASDETVYVAQNDTRIWKSSDGGGRFIGLAAPAAITALTVVDGSTYFTGHSTKVYKSGRWNYGTITGSATSIALSPDFADDDTVFVGNSDGDVYYSVNASATAGVIYSRLGATDGLGNTADVVVACDPEYADNSTIYAGSSNAATIGIMRWVVGTNTSWSEIDGTNTSGELYVDLKCSGLQVSADGSLYAAINAAAGNKGIRRSVTPTSATIAGRAFESVTTTLPAGTVLLENLDYIPGSNVLYAIASGCTGTTAYPHGYQLITLTDTFAITPTITAPDEGATVGGTVNLSWEAIPAPAGTTVTYSYEVSYDEAFANDVVDTTTTGTWVTTPSLTAGKKYYWRVYVAAGTTALATRKASSNFVVKLGAAELTVDLSSPAPGASDMPISPNFQWKAISGATSYELELADNADFTGATTKTLTVNVWACDTDLEYSTVYYWKVRALSADTQSGWSTGVFTTAAEAVEEVAPEITVEIPAPEVTVEIPAPEITVEAPPPAEITVEAPPPAEITVSPPEVTVELPPAEAPETPGYIWSIIAIGAVLVIAVIILIVRTRRAA